MINNKKTELDEIIQLPTACVKEYDLNYEPKSSWELVATPVSGINGHRKIKPPYHVVFITNDEQELKKYRACKSAVVIREYDLKYKNKRNKAIQQFLKG